MKLFMTYQKLKKKSLELLSLGKIDEYFDVLVQLTQLEKRLAKLHILN